MSPAVDLWQHRNLIRHCLAAEPVEKGCPAGGRFPPPQLAQSLIDGDLEFHSGTLEIEIGGFDSGLFDFLDITGSANLSDGEICFKSWDDYDFSDILPQDSISLMFLHADGGITDFSLSSLFEEGFLPESFGYEILNDGSSLTLLVANGNPVPIPSAVWLFVSGLIGLVCLRRNSQE